MTTQRRLHLVPFSGTDYSAGQVLLEKNGTTTSDPVSISSKLSLLFHFEDYAWVAASLPNRGSGALRCTLSYDKDEAVPTELRLRFTDGVPGADFTMLKSITVSFEIFRVCYEFSTNVLAALSSEDGSVELILSVPSSLTTVKHRRLPRI